MTKEQAFNDLFKEAGLKLEGIHGGLSNWIKEFDDGSKLYVTNESRTCIPCEDDEIIVVGLYGSEDEIFYYVRHRYVQTALAKVKQIIAGYPGEDFEL